MWLDYIRRDLITSGRLKKMIEEDGLRGMTSNPAIFEKAIGESSLYDDMLKSLASRKDLDTTARYEQIAIRDIQDAADVLRPVYDGSKFPGWVRQPGGFAAARDEDAGNDRRSPPLVEGGESRERDDQDSRHDGGTSRDSAGDWRRHQRQRDAAVRAGSIRESCGSAHRGA